MVAMAIQVSHTYPHYYHMFSSFAVIQNDIKHILIGSNFFIYIFDNTHCLVILLIAFSGMNSFLFFFELLGC